MTDRDIEIPAEMIAKGLALEPSSIPALMRSGAITSRCEKGDGEDAGLFRLTFFHGNRRLRLIVGADATLHTSSLIDFGTRPLPKTLRSS